MQATFLKTLILSFLSLCFVALISCTPSPPKYPTAGQQIQSTVDNSIKSNQALNGKKSTNANASINNALLPPLTLQLPNDANQAQEKHFNVLVKDIPAKEFFMGLVEGTPYNMLVDPATTGKITLQLKNVTIEQVLYATREMYGYQYKKTPLGYEILPSSMTTQIFNVNYLNVKRTGQSQTQLVSTDISNSSNNNSSYQSNNISNGANGNLGGQTLSSPQGSGSTVVTKADNDFWASLNTTLQTLVGNQDGRWIVTNPQASVVMVHAYPNELRQVSDYLSTVQTNLQREVVIEAKILEVTLSDQYQAGINWKIIGAQQLGATNNTDLSPDFPDTHMFGLTIGGQTTADFNAAINLLSQQGNVQVLSSPHISTINNQEAVIKVGDDQFFVTGYSSNITPTGSTNTTTQTVALNPFFSGITLDVTPQIGGNGAVTLYIHPSISLVVDQNKTIQMSNSNGGGNSDLTLPLANSTIRESDNVVHAESGQIVVIGGLMQNQTSEAIAGTPGLSKVPFVGALARNTNQISKKTELVILLRPVVIDNQNSNNTWNDQLQNEAKNFKAVQRGFHAGGLPEDFGSEAEKHP